MDDEIIYERGVVRLTVRQLCNLWLDMDDRRPMDIIDIQQPDGFTQDVEWALYSQQEGAGDDG